MAEELQRYTVKIDIVTDTRQMTQGIQQATTQLSGLDKTLGRIQRSLVSFAVLWTSRQIIGGIQESVAELGNFQKSLSQSATIIENSQMPQLFGNIANQVRAMSVEMGKNTEDLTKGLYDILSAMIPLDKSMDVLKLSSKAATAGVTDLRTAFRAGFGMLKAYNLQIEDLGKIYDKQFEAVKVGIVTYEELTGILGKLSPAAVKAGFSIDELLGALSFLTTRGLSASESGVALARMFDALSDPKKWEGFSNLGISIYNAEGKTRALADIIQDFGNILGKADAQTLALINSTFGFQVRAERAFIPAVKGAEDLAKHIEIIKNSQNALNDAYDRYISLNLGRELEIQQALWKEIQKSIGELALSSGWLDTWTDILREIGYILHDKVLLAYEKIPEKMIGIQKEIWSIKDILSGDPDILARIAQRSGRSVEFFTNMMEERIKSLEERLRRYHTLMGAFEKGRQGQRTPVPTTTAPTGTGVGDNINESQYWEQKAALTLAGTEQVNEILSQWTDWKKNLYINDILAFAQMEQEKLAILLEATNKQSEMHAALAEKKKQLDAAVFRISIAMMQTWIAQIAIFYSVFSQTLTMAIGESKKFGWALKALRMGQIVIDTAAAVMKAMAEVPYPLNTAVAGLVGVMGAIQLGIVSGQQFQKGGLVPGIGRGDTVPALLEPGEYVVPRNRVNQMTNNSNVNVNVSMAGAYIMDDPIAVEKLYREYLQPRIKQDIKSGRDKFYG